MNKHCPKLRQELKDIKSQYKAYILAIEKAKENKDYDPALNLQKTLKQAIDQLKFQLLNHLYNLDPQAFKAKLKERLKLDDIYDFHEGRARVKDQSGRYYIDLDGKEITTARFEVFWDFHEGRAKVKDQSGWYYIDLDGKEITTARFEYAWSFYKGRARVRDQSGEYYIDLDGKRIVDK